MMPTTIADKLRRLTEICDEYPNSIPVEVAAECMNQIKCGICPYYNTLDTRCDAAGKPAAKVNVCPQRRIRKAIKAKEDNP